MIIHTTTSFDIPKEVFQTLLSNSHIYYYYDYNIDVIYSNDEKRIDEYYSTGTERIGNIITKRFTDMIKGNIGFYIQENHKAEYDNWIKEKNNSDDWKFNEIQFSDYKCGAVSSNTFTASNRQWSIAEVVEHFKIPREKMEEIRKNAVNTTPACDINIDYIYNNPYSEIINGISAASDFTAKDPVLIDNSYITFDLDIQKQLWTESASLEYYG